LKLTKLANWFSEEDPEKNKPEKQPAAAVEAQNTRLAKTQLKIDKLNNELQESQKELAQTKAQLQINQGFQIELGETQLKLQQSEQELQRLKRELFEQQKQLQTVQTQYKSAQQTLAKLTAEQSWLTQIKTPVQITDIKKTLPKQDFETLWGFGILSPKIDTVITTGAILVRGWVLGKKAQAKKVKILFQGETLLEAAVNLRRPAIAQQYPDISAAGRSGFEFSLAVTGIPTEIELSLEALLEDQSSVSLCNFVLKSRTIESNDT